MTSRRKSRQQLLRWDRWVAHYPPTIAAPPSAIRAFKAVHQVPTEPEWDEYTNPLSDAEAARLAGAA